MLYKILKEIPDHSRRSQVLIKLEKKIPWYTTIHNIIQNTNKNDAIIQLKWNQKKLNKNCE